MADEPEDRTSDRKELASLLHDEVLQGVIVARWALDDIDPAALPPTGAQALAEAIRALDQTQSTVRQQVARLQGDVAGAPSGTTQEPRA